MSVFLEVVVEINLCECVIGIDDVNLVKLNVVSGFVEFSVLFKMFNTCDALVFVKKVSCWWVIVPVPNIRDVILAGGFVVSLCISFSKWKKR